MTELLDDPKVKGKWLEFMSLSQGIAAGDHESIHKAAILYAQILAANPDAFYSMVEITLESPLFSEAYKVDLRIMRDKIKAAHEIGERTDMSDKEKLAAIEGLNGKEVAG